MIVADMPFSPFLNLLRISAKKLNFHLIAILVAREADCRWAFEQLEKDWSSLHDVTGDKIIFITVDGEEHIPISDGGNGLKNNIGTLRGDYGLVTFSKSCKLYNKIKDDHIRQGEVLEWAQPIQEFSRHIQPLPRPNGWRNSQSLGISSVLSTLGLSESQAPCLYVEIVHTSHNFVLPITNNPTSEFSFYKSFKKILLDSDDSFKRIQNYSGWLHNQGNNLQIPRKVKDIANSLLWLRIWLESQHDLPDQVKHFVLVALKGDAHNKEVYRAISPLKGEIDQHTFSELRSHLDRITSLSELIPLAQGILPSDEKNHLTKKILTECQSVEKSIRNIFDEKSHMENGIKNPEKLSENIQIFANEVYMESKYKITGGQQGSVGDNSKAQDFSQINNPDSQQIDFRLLAEQLTLLISTLKNEAQDQDKKGGT